MNYKVGNDNYSFSYQELKTDYDRYVAMSNEEFLVNLPKILHFVCFVCYLKELPTSMVMRDDGIVHELVHLLDEQTKFAVNRLEQTRETFKTVCKLV